MLMEQMEYNLLFRWFVGLNMDEGVWVPTVFSKNRDRLMDGGIAEGHFETVRFFKNRLWKIKVAGFTEHFIDAAAPLFDEARVEEHFGDQPVSRFGGMLLL